MNRRLAFAAAAAFAIALAACGSGGGNVPATQPLPVTNGNSAIPPQLLVQAYGQGAMAGATYVGPVTNANLNVSVLVHQQNATGLIAYAQAVQDPTSGSFRHFLTPDQIATQFGAKQSDYQAVGAVLCQQRPCRQRMEAAVVAQRRGPASESRARFRHDLRPVPTQRAEVHRADDAAALHAAACRRCGRRHRALATKSHLYHHAAASQRRLHRRLFAIDGPRCIRLRRCIHAGYNGSGINLGIIATGPIENTCGRTRRCDLNSYSSRPTPRKRQP